MMAMALNCISCNEPLESEWDTCPNCLTPIKKELNCPSCGKELKENWKVCPSCKTPTGRGSANGTPVTPSTPNNIKSPSMDPNYSQLAGIEETQAAQPQRIQQIELTIEDTAADRYVIKKKIGQGGFGGVYEVFDNILDEQIAVKVLPFINKESIKNIILEYKSRDKIKSFEHVVKAYQPQQTQYKGQDIILYPMELADKSMREWLEEIEDKLEERLEEGLEIFKQACRGVEAIHEAGLIHLDLKPENILLTENKKAKDITQKWKVKISDFGLARGLGNTNLEMHQDGIGTPAYMAPEQIMAARWKDVTATADIYALGMILYELIDGDLPYSGTPQEIKAKKTNPQIPITPLQSTNEVSKVAMECLERDKTKRIRTVGAILIQLDKNGKEDEKIKKKSFQHLVECPSCNHKIKTKRIGLIKCRNCDHKFEIDDKGNIVDENLILCLCPVCGILNKVAERGAYPCSNCTIEFECDDFGNIIENNVEDLLDSPPDFELNNNESFIDNDLLVQCPNCGNTTGIFYFDNQSSGKSVYMCPKDSTCFMIDEENKSCYQVHYCNECDVVYTLDSNFELCGFCREKLL